MELTRQIVIEWAKKGLAEEGMGRKGKFLGKTPNGFYFFFWKVPIASAVGGVTIRNNRPAPGTPKLFVSKKGFVVLFWRVPDLMFDYYLNEGLITPTPMIDENGCEESYMGLPLYGVRVSLLTNDFHSLAAQGISPHEKYGFLPNPEEL